MQTIQYNAALDVALGNNRKTKAWKNQTMQWSELLGSSCGLTDMIQNFIERTNSFECFKFV